MRTSSLIFSFLLLCYCLSAQAPLVDFSLVTFHSKLEKTVLTDHFRKAETDNFLMFMGPGTLLNDAKVNQAKASFHQSLATYKDEKFAAKKNDKKIRQIHDDIHKRFLKKFQYGSAFEEIFHNGNYDHVTAVALFAMAFNELNIPYVIKEEPSNVYLLVYPESERIKLEAAAPSQQFFVISDAFKQQYVKVLKDQKIISSQEYSSKSINSLFDVHYYGNQQNITLLNLLGLMYLNEAQRNADNQDFEAAYNLSEKAYLLYPSAKTKYALIANGSQSFQRRHELDSARAIQLAKLSRFTELGITTDVIQSEFAAVINVLLFDKGKRGDLEKFHRVLTNHIDNIQLRSDLDFLYYYENARYLYNQGKYKEALPLSEKSLSIKPDKQDAVNGLISTLGKAMSSGGNNLQSIKLLEEYAKKFPALHDNNAFNNAMLSSYLLQFAMEYDMNNAKDGEKYRLLFEEVKERFPDVDPDAQLIGEAYSRAAVHFYRKGQTTKAKNLLDTGLKYSPNNYQLVSRKRMIQ